MIVQPDENKTLSYKALKTLFRHPSTCFMHNGKIMNLVMMLFVTKR